MNCQQPLDKHVEGTCLFQPTDYLPVLEVGEKSMHAMLCELKKGIEQNCIRHNTRLVSRESTGVRKPGMHRDPADGEESMYVTLSKDPQAGTMIIYGSARNNGVVPTPETAPQRKFVPGKYTDVEKMNAATGRPSGAYPVLVPDGVGGAGSQRVHRGEHVHSLPNDGESTPGREVPLPTDDVPGGSGREQP